MNGCKRCKNEPRRVKAAAKKRSLEEQRARWALEQKAHQAAFTAYSEQERRTVDPVVKRAVSAAVWHMFALVFDRPWKADPVTLGDVQRMESQIKQSASRSPATAEPPTGEALRCSPGNLSGSCRNCGAVPGEPCRPPHAEEEEKGEAARAPFVCGGCGVQNWDRVAAQAHAKWCETLPGRSPPSGRTTTWITAKDGGCPIHVPPHEHHEGMNECAICDEGVPCGTCLHMATVHGRKGCTQCGCKGFVTPPCLCATPGPERSKT